MTSRTIRKLSSITDAADAVERLQQMMPSGLRPLVGSFDGPSITTQLVLVWLERVEAGDPGAVADYALLCDVLNGLGILHAGRFTYSPRPRRRARVGEPPFDLQMHDRGGALPIAMAVCAVTEILIRHHGDAGCSATRAFIEADQARLRAISELLART
jgi:hypothetical protein